MKVSVTLEAPRLPIGYTQDSSEACIAGLTGQHTEVIMCGLMQSDPTFHLHNWSPAVIETRSIQICDFSE